MRLFFATVALLACVQGIQSQQPGQVHGKVLLQGDFLSQQLIDINEDGLDDLLVAWADEDAQRWISVYEQAQAGVFPAEPTRKIKLLKDIVSWGVGEFRPDDAGAELLFLTSGRAWSFSPNKSSYRGNLKPIVDAEMLLDLPSNRSLPKWDAVGDVDLDGVDDVALAVRDGFLIASPKKGVLGSISIPLRKERRPMASGSLAGARAVVNAERLSDLLVPKQNAGELSETLWLYASETLPMPHLADANGDGFLDLIWYQKPKIRVHLQHEGAFQNEAQLMLSIPTQDVSIADLSVVHAMGGASADLLITRMSDGGELTRDWQVALFPDAFAAANDSGELIKLGKPQATATLDTSFARGICADFNADGKTDLGISAWALTLDKLGLEGLDVVHKVALFLQDKDGSFPKRASTSYRRNYNVDDFSAFSLVPALNGDLSGDGMFDLIEPTANGSLEVRPLRKRGRRLMFSSRPSLKVQVNALASLVHVVDVNRDGIQDMLIFHQDVIETLVSMKK